MVFNNYALAAVVRQGNGNIANFDAVTARLLRVNPRLRAWSVSPGGVVQKVAPLEGNEKLLGFDQIKDPLQMREAVFARDTHRLTLAVPVELAQGGVDVVSRLPVFPYQLPGQKRFWRFTNVSMLLPDLLSGWPCPNWRREATTMSCGAWMPTPAASRPSRHPVRP